MIKTLPLKDVEKNAANIYEAIIVAAKRARQINDDQKEELSREREEFDDDYDRYDDEDPETLKKPLKFTKMPKPASVALKEFMDGKVGFEHRGFPEEEEKKAE